MIPTTGFFPRLLGLVVIFFSIDVGFPVGARYTCPERSRRIVPFFASKHLILLIVSLGNSSRAKPRLANA
jgi:hypothetical protein